MAVVATARKTSFIDKAGREVLQIKYELVDPFSEGLALFTIEEKHEGHPQSSPRP
jgi:hypothetical protein